MNDDIPMPKDAMAAWKLATVAERAARLWDDGYTWKKDMAEGGEFYLVTSPQGTAYTVDPVLNFRCACPSWQENKYCKHSLAVRKLDADLLAEAQLELLEAEADADVLNAETVAERKMRECGYQP